MLRSSWVKVANRSSAYGLIQQRRLAVPRLTGQPTFVRGPHPDDGIGNLLLAFSGAFAVTVGVLHFQKAGQEEKGELRPIRYDHFEVQEARKTTSPSLRDETSHDDHIYLKINAPLSKEAKQISSLSTKADHVQILSVHMKEPTLQIERPYTPLYSDPLYGFDAPVELLIKRYEDGELGKYAHRLKDNVQVELRGPSITWQGPKPDHFVLIVGGTGITPAYQLLNTLISQSSHLGTPMPRFTLLYGSSKSSSILLAPEISRLKRDFPEHVDILLFAEDIDASARAQMSWTDWLLGKSPVVEGLPIRKGRISESSTRSILDSMREKSPGKKRKILVCGPDGMMEAIAGPKQGQQQGQFGGMLRKLGCSEDEVWKL